MNVINNVVNFRARLDVSNIKSDSKRWDNIAKIFKHETKGLNYVSRPFLEDDTLEIYVNKVKNVNKKTELTSDFATKVAKLTKDGTVELLAKSDDVIAKTLAKHVEFVQSMDNSYKNALKIFNKAHNYVYNLFKNNGYEPDLTDDVMEDIFLDVLTESKMISDYKKILNQPGFKDATISHNY